MKYNIYILLFITLNISCSKEISMVLPEIEKNNKMMVLYNPTNKTAHDIVLKNQTNMISINLLGSQMAVEIDNNIFNSDLCVVSWSFTEEENQILELDVVLELSNIAERSRDSNELMVLSYRRSEQFLIEQNNIPNKTSEEVYVSHLKVKNNSKLKMNEVIVGSKNGKDFKVGVLYGGSSKMYVNYDAKIKNAIHIQWIDENGKHHYGWNNIELSQKTVNENVLVVSMEDGEVMNIDFSTLIP